jgi:formyl-CoA transferase
MSRALQDIVLVDFTTESWASLAAAMLADFGARVIRLENLPEAGENGGNRDGQHPPSDWNYQAELVQRNKLSLGVDLEQDSGREILTALVRKADVFLTDRPFAVLEQKGWDYAAFSKLRPELVYARGSGFGPKGPDRDLPALDELAAARTGMMPILPQPGEPPVYAGAGPMYTTVMLAFGIVTALHHRQETGQGQEVDASLFAGNMYGASLDLQAFLAMGGERFLHPVSRLDAGNPMSGTLYPSQDGRWVTLTMPDTDRWWPVFSGLVGLDADDPRFDSHEKRCGENRLLLMEVLERAFAKQPGAHWRNAFNENQLSADVIEAYAYPAADEQAYRNRYILKLDHPSFGAIKTLGFPVFMSESPARLRAPAPCRGQHSAEILHEILGYSEDRIGDLEARGVIV